MKNIEKYKDEIKSKIKKNSTLNCAVADLRGNALDECFQCNNCGLKSLDWLLEEYEEPSILTNKEKIIIKNIMKAFEPFGEELSYITKKECYSNTWKHYLVFRYKNVSFCTLEFNNDELFEGMESDVDYTLEDLGL